MRYWTYEEKEKKEKEQKEEEDEEEEEEEQEQEHFKKKTDKRQSIANQWTEDNIKK